VQILIIPFYFFLSFFNFTLEVFFSRLYFEICILMFFLQNKLDFLSLHIFKILHFFVKRKLANCSPRYQISNWSTLIIFDFLVGHAIYYSNIMYVSNKRYNKLRYYKNLLMKIFYWKFISEYFYKEIKLDTYIKLYNALTNILR